jgi:CubicO group peptidase (beta-lactamase class C family)
MTPGAQRIPCIAMISSFVRTAIVLITALVTPLSGRAENAWPLPTNDAQSAGFSVKRLDFLHHNLEQMIDAGKYSGYITLLARDGKIADWHAYGWQDAATKTPMQKDSIVRIFSMSKLITSTAILILMEEGRLKLTDPVEKYLPVLKNRKVFTGGTSDSPVLVDAKRPIAIRDLLTHTSGYYYGESWSADAPLVEIFNRAKVWEAGDLQGFVERIAAIPLHEQPGTRFRYGVNTDLLGAIVEKISGQHLDRFFRERIFSPLDMRDTAFWVPAEKRRRLAVIYERDVTEKLVPNARSNQPPAGPDHGILSGGGGLYSTAADYARFAQMLLNRGELDGVRILGRKTVELMTRNHISHLADPHPFGFQAQGFGLGVRVLGDLGESTTLGSHGTFGWDGAATTLVQIDPKERIVAILLFQHIPFNQDDIFSTFNNGYYSALEN